MIWMFINTPCINIIEKLCSLFHDINYSVNDAGTNPDDLVFVTKWQEAIEKLRSSDWILEMIHEHLSSKWDMDDDSSLHKTVLRPDLAASRNCRKHKAKDSNEQKMPFN